MAGASGPEPRDRDLLSVSQTAAPVLAVHRRAATRTRSLCCGSSSPGSLPVRDPAWRDGDPLADTRDLGRGPVYQELRRSVQPSLINSPALVPGRKGLSDGIRGYRSCEAAERRPRASQWSHGGTHGLNRLMSLQQRDALARQQSDRGHAPRSFTHWCHDEAIVQGGLGTRRIHRWLRAQRPRSGRTRQAPGRRGLRAAGEAFAVRPATGPDRSPTNHRCSLTYRPRTSVVRRHVAHRPARHCAGWPTAPKRGRRPCRYRWSRQNVGASA